MDLALPGFVRVVVRPRNDGTGCEDLDGGIKCGLVCPCRYEWYAFYTAIETLWMGHGHPIGTHCTMPLTEVELPFFDEGIVG